MQLAQGHKASKGQSWDSSHCTAKAPWLGTEQGSLSPKPVPPFSNLGGRSYQNQCSPDPKKCSWDWGSGHTRCLPACQGSWHREPA